jgi:hypothetical protein
VPQGYSPGIFVSSTCYDLSQIRSNIKSFIESLGLDPILSEYNTFPVNPDITTVQNCLDNVKQKADIMILIIGNRYGFQNIEGKSITNLEYLQAKAKGIPIYVFISKSILNSIPIWENNPSADFTSVVDDLKLFEFVKSVKGNIDHWVFPFESIEDIVITIRRQLSYLFMDALLLKQKVEKTGIHESLINIKGDALRILIEKPIGWEYLFFSHGLLDELHMYDDLRNDLQFRIHFGRHISISEPKKILDWLVIKIQEIKAIAEGMNGLINNALQQALGPRGQPGNPDLIIYVVRRLGIAYKQAIEWALDFDRTIVPEDFQRLVKLASTMTQNIIDDTKIYAESLHLDLHTAVDDVLKKNKSVVLESTLKLTLPDLTEFTKERIKLARKYTQR